METKKDYLVSLLLSASAYERVLDNRLLRALRDSALARKITAPKFLLGSPNRSFFLDGFLDALRQLPCGAEICNSEEDFARELELYEDGRPDPLYPGELWRVVNLDLRLNLGGGRQSRLLIRELPDEQLVLISFAFAAETLLGGGLVDNPEAAGDLRLFREFLLALVAACPVLVGTLGLDLTAWQIAMMDDMPLQGDPMALNQLAKVLEQPEGVRNFDFVIFSAAVAGGDRPFVYDLVAPELSFPGGEEEAKYHNLGQVKELVELLNRAERDYDRMYDAPYPKDNRDYAMLFLHQARQLAESLGYVELAGEIQKRHDHIDAVYNAQFRFRY